MLDHISIKVTDLERSKAFYSTALHPLGYVLISDFGDAVGFGVTSGPAKSKDPGGEFWISIENIRSIGIHIAFNATDHSAVDEFHNCAVVAGGKDNGAPGLRTRYHEYYYAAFILDPDGNNIEAVCHMPIK